jgi:hypothetical protein
MIWQLLNQPLIRIRAPVTADRYGGQVRDWSAATRTTLYGRLETEERRAEEHNADRTQLTARGVAFFPAGSDILGTDRLEDGAGVRYEIIGQISTQSTPRGPHHLEVRVTAVTG